MMPIDPGMSRALFTRAELARLISPCSIAVVGASPRAGTLGNRAMRNLARFRGEVWPVNPRYDQIDDRACYAALADLPAPPDCAVLAVAQDQVESLVRECARLGVGGAVVFASGYAETGAAAGLAAQQRLQDIATTRGLRLVGPNTTGFVNHLIGASAGFAEFPAPDCFNRATIGLVTQSGAMGLGLSQAVMHGASISHVLTAGNSCDVDVADHVAWLAEEPQCRAIALAYEGLAAPNRLEQAVELARLNGKAVVAFKLGISPEGALAAQAHTGVAAGDEPAFAAMAARIGLIIVPRAEMLVEAATFFAKAPLKATAAAVAILSNSGGTAIMAADAAFHHGLPLPQPQGGTLAAIVAAIPPFGAARNPCDATAQGASNPASVEACAEALLADPRYGALVVPWGKATPSPLLARLGALAAAHGKPVCLVWQSQWLEGPGAREAESDPHLALFRSMDSCFHTLAAWFARAG